jgi:hypothetical protein
MAHIIPGRSLRRCLYFLLPLLLLCGGCKKSQQTRGRSGSSPAQTLARQQARSPEPKINACNLITTDEVGAIQGAEITGTKSNAGWSGNLLMSQCYYAAMKPNKSVSVAAIEKDSQSAQSDPRRFWAQTLSPFKAAARDEEKTREKNENSGGEARDEQERKMPSKKIDGVGEEAFWSGNRFGGALYVLKDDVIVRVSVGGPDDEETKIAKSKALAEKALSRLGF